MSAPSGAGFGRSGTGLIPESAQYRAVEFRGEMETQMLNYEVVILVREAVDGQTI
jgi:hypothetical protein